MLGISGHDIVRPFLNILTFSYEVYAFGHASAFYIMYEDNVCFIYSFV